jgi:hypothetical protein
MFKKKKKNTNFEFNLKLIEKIGTCNLRIEELYKRIHELEIELKKHINGGHN